MSLETVFPHKEVSFSRNKRAGSIAALIRRTYVQETEERTLQEC